MCPIKGHTLVITLYYVFCDIGTTKKIVTVETEDRDGTQNPARFAIVNTRYGILIKTYQG